MQMLESLVSSYIEKALFKSVLYRYCNFIREDINRYEVHRLCKH